MQMKKHTVILATIIGIVFAVICIVLAVIGVKSFYNHVNELAREQEEKNLEIGKKSFQWELDQVRVGKQDFLIFDQYSIFKYVDQKLKELEGMKEVSVIFIRGTDFSDQGMKSINSFPRLKKLGIIGPSLSDEGLASLKSNTSLEILFLALKNSEITDKGLEVFKTIPNLKTLVLYQYSAITPRMSNGLKILKELKQIKDLRVGGGGFTRQEIEELQHALPHAKIKWLTDWPDDYEDVLGEQFEN
jgi:hypothetical protein